MDFEPDIQKFVKKYGMRAEPPENWGGAAMAEGFRNYKFHTVVYFAMLCHLCKNQVPISKNIVLGRVSRSKWAAEKYLFYLRYGG